MSNGLLDLAHLLRPARKPAVKALSHRFRGKLVLHAPDVEARLLGVRRPLPLLFDRGAVDTAGDNRLRDVTHCGVGIGPREHRTYMRVHAFSNPEGSV